MFSEHEECGKKLLECFFYSILSILCVYPQVVLVDSALFGQERSSSGQVCCQIVSCCQKQLKSWGKLKINLHSFATSVMFWKVDLYLKPTLGVRGLDCDSNSGKLLASGGESFGDAFAVCV